MGVRTVVLRGEGLELDEVVAIARGRARVQLDAGALRRVEQARACIERRLATGGVYYGINTGFGALSNVHIQSDQLAELQPYISELRLPEGSKLDGTRLRDLEEAAAMDGSSTAMPTAMPAARRTPRYATIPSSARSQPHGMRGGAGSCSATGWSAGSTRSPSSSAATARPRCPSTSSTGRAPSPIPSASF